MKNFNEIKEEVLSRAKKAGACKGEYKRALKSESIQELLKVITDNFFFSCKYKIIDVDFLEKIGKETCEISDLFFNTNSYKGFLLASDNATVFAYGSATVYASDSAKVSASDSATVNAYNSAKVSAYGSATVYAYNSTKVSAYNSATVNAFGSAYINSFNNVEHKVSDKAILRYYHDDKVVLADVGSLSK